MGQSNYDRLLDEWRLRFLEMDHDALAERFSLRSDEGALYIQLFDREIRIDRSDGRLSVVGDASAELGFDAAMTVYNIFHYAVPHPAPLGRLVPFREVRRVYPFEAAFRRQGLAPFEKAFTGRSDALQRALDRMGAVPFGQGDAGGRVDLLPGLSLAVTFWDADDEFDAQANLLFDYNITDYMHEETVVLVAYELLHRLKSLSKP